MINVAAQRVFLVALLSLSTLDGSQPAHSAPFQGEREGTCANAATLFPDTNPGPGSLKRIAVPEPTDLGSYVRDRSAAIVLGKALFWDMQVGSDGIVACATCHFRAGADPRSVNQLNPGGQDNPRQIVDLGINRWLRPADFPLRQLADPSDRRSAVLRDSDDVVSSAGVKLSRFVGVQPGADHDMVQTVADPVFNLSGLNTRRAEPRNTPTVINAAFNRRQFWDVRASNLFNGVSPFGAGDEKARVLFATEHGKIRQVKIRIDNAGLASQAVGPPLSDREMGSLDRKFRDIGKRLASARPLRKQQVAGDDSVLGRLARTAADRHRDEFSDRGLDTTYRALIEAAFQPHWWQSQEIVVVRPDGRIEFEPTPGRALRANEYTMLEYNFSLFFGLAVQLYEMTLISDDAPVDRHFEGTPRAMTAQQLRGMDVFTGDAACAACHSGAETTNNSVRILMGTIVDGVKQPAEVVERMFNGNCEVVAYDQGVYNLGVRPFEEDIGIGGKDPFGNPLAFISLLTSPPKSIPSKELLTLPIPNIANPPISAADRALTTGAFKVPNLRNLALTAPYFHNGGQATIRQAVEFYNRGGDFREHNAAFVDFEVGKLNLTAQQIDDLVDFLTTALTDPRVVRQSAPFDHPQLFVPNGHETRGGVPVVEGDGTARDLILEIPAVGRNGGPLQAGFLERR
ncbi:MAG TPA: cytochrome c peroxidase [Burkholderiaceae bacterium]|nr:cytochrome c peroxidase [Burkholderiaceae bacterium]